MSIINQDHFICLNNRMAKKPSKTLAPKVSPKISIIVLLSRTPLKAASYFSPPLANGTVVLAILPRRLPQPFESQSDTSCLCRHSIVSILFFFPFFPPRMVFLFCVGSIPVINLLKLCRPLPSLLSTLGTIGF